MQTEFYKNIAASTAHRPVRDALAQQAMDNENTCHELIALALSTNNKHHYKACWILELVLEKDMALLAGYLTAFCNTLPDYRHDGAVRSVSKICLFIVTRHIKSWDGFITKAQQPQITEACFDWLIGGAKVAAKAYAMRTLFLLGKTESWIYPELQQILQQDYHKHSAGYKAAARDILMKMEHG